MTPMDRPIPISVKPTGENYTFEFDKSPGSESRQLRAASAVFKTIYADESIAPLYHQTFMKRRGALLRLYGQFLFLTDDTHGRLYRRRMLSVD